MISAFVFVRLELLFFYFHVDFFFFLVRVINKLVG